MSTRAAPETHADKAPDAELASPSAGAAAPAAETGENPGTVSNAQQKPKLFSPLEVGAWGGFVRTQAILFRAIEEDLRDRAGLTHPEFEVLLRLFLNSSRQARIQDLARASLLTRSGTSRLVERLEKSGLLRREEAPEDGRGTCVQLTDEGAALFLQAAEHHVTLVRKRFLSHFSPDELVLLGTFWRRINSLPANGLQPEPSEA